MNRTDRLYALVEELRACAPCRRSARELALLYKVSARTIERDSGALQQAGVPVYADAGRSGGYTVDKSLTLPPLNFTPAGAVAVAVALARVNVGPFEGAARSAVQKIVAAMPGPDVVAARYLAGRVRLPSRCPRSSSGPSSRAGCCGSATGTAAGTSPNATSGLSCSWPVAVAGIWPAGAASAMPPGASASTGSSRPRSQA